MLNELHKLSVALNSADIEHQEWHKDYREMPNSNCYRIWLSNNGCVVGLEHLDKTLVASCRKYGNNQRSFPAFNIAPLYRISNADDADFKKMLEGKAESNPDRLHEMCTSGTNNWNKKLLNKTKACLKKQIPTMPNHSAIVELMRIANKLNDEQFHDELEMVLWSKLNAGGDTREFLPLLIYKGSRSKDDKPENDTGSLSIILDLQDWRTYGYPIASAETTRQINEWLLNADRAENAIKEPRTGEQDAFGAPYSHGCKPESMPGVRLGSGFNVVLRSMFHKQQCQFRYRKADDESYPISPKNRADAKKSLEWIVRPENEYVTWQRINNNAILFVYPDKIPEVPLPLTPLFGGQTNTNNETRFEKIAERFITVLDGLPSDQKPENIHVFALQQIPPPLSKRAKVVLTRNCTPEELIASAKEWQCGCLNFPGLQFAEPKAPFPLNVSEIVNRVWKQNGKRADTTKSSVKLMRYYQGMELLVDIKKSQLDVLKEAQLSHYLRGLLVNSFGLICHVGNKLPREKLSDEHKKAVGETLALIGLILYKCGYEKEVYMESEPYLLGQMLKISDKLHELYCKVKRDGDIPPQLVGNSLFAAAAETPNKSLAILGTRMIPYIGWANQYKTQRDKEGNPLLQSGLAAWYCLMYEKAATKLKSALTETTRFNDYEKAQLFIGYLAALQKTDIENTDGTNKEEVQ